MHTDFWLERWQQNQIGFHEQETNAHLQEFWKTLNIPKGSKIFIPLCGKSRDILWLLSLGYQAVGVEISPLAVENFFAENKLEAKISACDNFQLWKADGLSVYLGNFFELSSIHLTDCNAIYDRAALIALPAEMRQQYVQHLKKIAPELSHTLLVTLEYAQHEMPGPPFSVNENEVHSLFANTCDIELLFAEDILHDNDYFRERGLSSLVEKVYRLSTS
ncbi:MAG: thiopurine S-methyltransferase [Gammaproteobacteria bacterium]|nr:MAG: thiopurine S-methyltransferase [Gammaproteobacteria bacterium]